MAKDEKYLAVDLGASSGRVLAGLFDGERLRLEETHRFENGSVATVDHLHWDLLALWKNIVEGLRASRAKLGGDFVSVGVDTWGVDFGLLDRNDELLGSPYCYRDPQTEGMVERAFEIVPREDIFAETGLQFMPINTLYQLLALKERNSPLLEVAKSLLMIPDLFHWLLTGEKANELTDASTTQFYNPKTKSWAHSLLDRFGLPTGILCEIVPPGTNLGKLRAPVAKETGLNDLDVVLPGTHDTASAVMAVPAAGEIGGTPDWCYISSGTWSLMGVEVPAPIINNKCAELNLTNEGGVGGTTRVLKNIGGLWLVQECRRIWKQAGHDFAWSDLVRLAEQSSPLESLIDPDHACFTAPADMPAAIREFCRSTSQPVPQSEGAVIRCALESLALRYRLVHGWLEQLIDNRIKTIHIVGGGAQNKLLCQMAADATGCRVVAGPVEATAIGNVMMQAVASGAVGSIAEARDVIRRSFDVDEYTPRAPQTWDNAFERFQSIVH